MDKTIEIIKHISASSLSCFENDKQEFYNRYVLGIKVDDNEHFKFGRDYEDLLAELKYKDFKRQIKIEEDFEGYCILGFVDFGNDDTWIEVKTKSGRRSENDIRKSWQFRIYNHFKGDKKFYIHQYNKKVGKEKIQEIDFEDEYFVPELYCKIKEIEQFLAKYGVKLWRK